MGQVLDPSRSLGMTGGWGVGGEAITRDCTNAGTPPLILRRAQHERPHPWGWLHGIGALTARGLGMAGDDMVLLLRGGPPLILRRAQHERPCPWGWLHGIGALTARGLGVTVGVGGGWGGDHAGLHLCGHPPRSYFDGLSTSGPARPVDSGSESGMTGGSGMDFNQGAGMAVARGR